MKSLIEKNAKIVGFTCIDKKFIDEMNGTMYEMVHDQTKAKLIYIQNEDKNKWFSVAFKTVPENDTGVFHILEHSVLCGSKKYPLKAPFVELLKSSMNTFLNAMTFPDKTVYPVGSRNEKDFMNMVQVYLDAVFCPAIYENDNIFRQEGWHYELRNEKDTAEIKGVVFNEMKGTEADVNRLISNELQRELYKDSCYYYISGGASEAIPDLTYEDYIHNHEKFYHPSNAIFFLSGDLDLEKVLNQIEEYLKDKEYRDDQITISYPTVPESCEIHKEYPVSPEEDTANMTQIVFGKLLWDYTNKEKMLASMLLTSYLTESNDAPLSKLVLEKELGQDIVLSVEDGILQSYLKLKISNTEEEKKEEIRKEIFSLIEEIAKTGIDRKHLEATLNTLEFMNKEVEEPRGLYDNIKMLQSYLYGGAPDLFLTYNETFEFLRKQLDTDYYEKLLLEMFDQEHMVTLIMSPSKTRSQELKEQEQARIAKAQSSWSKEEVDAILAMNQKLDQWQATADTKEVLDLMPKLSIQDIDELPEENITIEKKFSDVTMLLHPVNIQGIAYINLYFPIPKAYENQIMDIALMSEQFMDIATVHRGLAELLQDIKMYLGNMEIELAVNHVDGNTDEATVYFVLKCAVLKQNISHAVRLIKEVLLETDFSLKEDIRNNLVQIQQYMRRAIIGNGHRYGMKRSAAPFSVANTLMEKVDGVELYLYLKEFLNDFDAKFDELLTLFEEVVQQTFVRNEMILSISASDINSADFEKEYAVEELVSVFPQKEAGDYTMTQKMERQALEFVAIPSAVAYASASSNLVTLGDQYKGAWRVATKMVSLTYLWNAIRVQGGAYGAGLAVGPSGNLSFYSYRDPKGAESVEKYKGCGAFLRQFVESKESFENFVISSVSDTEPLLSQKEKTQLADLEWFRKTGYEFQCRIRKELLSMTYEELLECADLLDKMWENASICVIGQDDAGLEVTNRIDI